jgi:hypothetical protein
MSATTALGALAAVWVGVALLLALVMGRHGHDPFAWWLLGTLLGPLALPLAVSAQRRRGGRVWLVRAGRPGRGPVDVLVGLDAPARPPPPWPPCSICSATEGGYDLLVVGSRGLGLSKVLRLGRQPSWPAADAGPLAMTGRGTRRAVAAGRVISLVTDH